MINRILIRIKIIQLLYSNQLNEGKSIEELKNELLESLDKTYELYHWLLQLIIDLRDFAEKRIEFGLNKRYPTDEDLNPNRRFIQNKIAIAIANNAEHKEYAKANGISWEEYADLIKGLFEAICDSEYYKTYMSAREHTYADDKMIWRQIFKKVIFTYKPFEERLESMDLYWNDDIEIVASFVEKTIKKCEEEKGSNQELLPQYRDEEDKDYALLVLSKALEYGEDYKDLVKSFSQNWEKDRIATMDMSIMQAAIAEINFCPTIPVNVTLNEFIEISKYYSSEKSSLFINGILDRVVNKYKEEKSLLKVGMYVNN
jgi:N utilization substance protein B